MFTVAYSAESGHCLQDSKVSRSSDSPAFVWIISVLMLRGIFHWNCFIGYATGTKITPLWFNVITFDSKTVTAPFALAFGSAPDLVLEAFTIHFAALGLLAFAPLGMPLLLIARHHLRALVMDLHIILSTNNLGIECVGFLHPDQVDLLLYLVLVVFSVPAVNANAVLGAEPHRTETLAIALEAVGLGTSASWPLIV